MAGGPCRYHEEALAMPGQRRSPQGEDWRSGWGSGGCVTVMEGSAGGDGRRRWWARKVMVGEGAPTAPSHVAPPSCLCRPKRVGFGRGISGESEPTGEEVVGAGPGGDWVHMRVAAMRTVGRSMGRRRRTARASRLPRGGAARVGVGRFRGYWLEAGRREVEVGVGGRGGRTMASGGCSCTTILASRPSKGGVARHGSGQLRAIEG